MVSEGDLSPSAQNVAFQDTCFPRGNFFRGDFYPLVIFFRGDFFHGDFYRLPTLRRFCS